MGAPHTVTANQALEGGGGGLTFSIGFLASTRRSTLLPSGVHVARLIDLGFKTLALLGLVLLPLPRLQDLPVWPCARLVWLQ
jgi:hypothetical protein